MGEREVEGYLAVVERQLPGPPSVRRDVLDELRDGLIEAREQAAEEDAHAPTIAAMASFGDPSTIGAALAIEVRLRLARRRALQILTVFGSLNVGWLVYRWGVGFPAAMIPDESTGAVFLQAVATLRGVGWVALIGALLMAVVTSSRSTTPVQIGVAIVTTGATTLAAVTGVTAMVLVAQPDPGALVAGAASAALLLATVAGSSQALRHLLACATTD